METNKNKASNNQFETNLIKSENYFEDNQTSNALSHYLKKFSTRPDGKDSNKSSELLTLIEASSAKWNINDCNNDISYGLKNLEYEAGLTENEFEYSFIRARSHTLYTMAIAQACYFVGIANRIRRNVDDIKHGNQTIQKNSLLISEMNQTQGLKIGIIGCGKIGRQLAVALLEYSKVAPSELQISTRQPETLTQLKNRNIKCYFDNGLLASSCNIIFICVLPSQLYLVVNEIKKYLPDKCIIYSFVRSESSIHLKNLLGDIPSSIFIIKAQYDINIKMDHSQNKWNYSLNVTESLNDSEVIKATNPFTNEEASDTTIVTNENFSSTIIYAFLDMCIFLSLNQQETMFCMKKFIFNSEIKNIKIDETLFYDINDEEKKFEVVDLVNSSLETTPLLTKLKQNKNYKVALSKNYNEYFEESIRFKNSFS